METATSSCILPEGYKITVLIIPYVHKVTLKTSCRAPASKKVQMEWNGMELELEIEYIINHIIVCVFFYSFPQS